MAIPHEGERELLTGNKSAAYGALLSEVRCAPFFPITPQTGIMEAFAEWKSAGVYQGEFHTLESEHSVLSSAIGSQLTGQRTFTGSSSQGLMLMFEMLPIASGLRLPMVVANVSRGLSAPITLWCDHNDVLMTRDTGFVTFICESNQEILDSVIIAYRVAEDERVLLPAMVNMDGFTHSFTREPVDIPSVKEVRSFLPELRQEVTLDTEHPKTLGIPVMSEYTLFRQQVHRAQRNALTVVDRAHREFAKLTGRKYSSVESFRMENAECAIVGIGANASIMKAAVEEMRKEGRAVGMVRLRLIRPFPYDEVAEALRGTKCVAVVDQNLSPGSGGILYTEVSRALRKYRGVVCDYIAGLGGKPVSVSDVRDIAENAMRSKTDTVKWVM